ncbi:MAG: Fe-S cluster assembly sulfur transfer protein SufU [Myxococcota bacterium]
MKGPYPELLMDHARTPRHEGPLPSATHGARLSNPLCGDRMHLHLRLEEETIVAARFEARGCVLCRGSASILTELLVGASPAAATELVHALERALDGEATKDPPSLAVLAELRELPGRRRCVTLAWESLLEALGPKGRRT